MPTPTIRALYTLLLTLTLAAPCLATDDFHVTVSIKPIHSLVSGLMEGTTPPELLIKGEISPYNFQLSSDQQRDLAKTDLLIWVGPELEESLVEPLKSLPASVTVMELLSNRELKILPARHDDSQRDPFFWLDDRNAIIMVNNLAKVLQKADPARSHLYARNRLNMMQELTRIDREFEYGYRGLKGEPGVQYHDTLRYFEQAYALKIIDHVALSPTQPTEAADLLRIRRLISSGEVVCLLTEAGMPMEQLPLLTKDTTINIGAMDSLGIRFEAGPRLYFDLMRYNTDVIKRCLNADMGEADEAKQLAALEDTTITKDVIGGRFMLQDHHGQLITEEQMHGSYQLIYFGYTFCPDICPTALHVITEALKILGEKAEQLQPYFVTIDPERDTIAVMNKYVSYFNPRFIGITGRKEMIARMAKQYGVRYEKVIEDAPSPDMYLMDHSASVYLMDPDGNFIAKFADGISPETLAAKIEEGMR